VTKKDLVNCWRGGARSVGDLIAGTRAGTGCGSCRDTVEGILGWLRSTEEECA
jgi:assimilatory nitrate reductase electron transfer subunit